MKDLDSSHFFTVTLAEGLHRNGHRISEGMGQEKVYRINTSCEVPQRACVRRSARRASNPTGTSKAVLAAPVSTPSSSFESCSPYRGQHGHATVHPRAHLTSRATAGDLRRRGVPEGPGQRFLRAERHRWSRGYRRPCGAAAAAGDAVSVVGSGLSGPRVPRGGCEPGVRTRSHAVIIFSWSSLSHSLTGGGRSPLRCTC